MSQLPARPMLTSMVEELQSHRVEVSFVGPPPTRQVERASGVSDVAVEGSILRCLVCGSFQPFLEALRGYEVVSLTSDLLYRCIGGDQVRSIRERRQSDD